MRLSRLKSLCLAASFLAAAACTSASSSKVDPACAGTGGALASAGPDRLVSLGETVELAGGAFETSGQPSYLWRLESIPPLSRAALTVATAPGATFVADQAGVYVASLSVRDACGPGALDVVTITVPGAVCVAPPPVADAGPNQALSYRTYLVLDGGASHASGPGSLTYRWWIESRPASSTAWLQQANTVSTTFSPDRSGTYVFGLVVNDGCQDSAPDLVTVTVPNSAPGASGNYLQDQPVLVPVSLGAWAYDSDGDPLTYAWTVLSRPAGSTATLSDATAPNPTVVPDRPGSYTFSLTVSDGLATSPTALVSFTAYLALPVASAGADQAGAIGVTVRLDGSASADANRTPLAIAWTLASPSGSHATLAGADGPQPTFLPDLPGLYRASLQVTSGGDTASDEVVVGVWPTVRRLPHRLIDAAYSDPLERIVMVSADPSALTLLDPGTGAETTVALALAPDALALSPDGLTAAVGHAGAFTLVDLGQASAGAPIAISGDVADLALGSSRAWIVPRLASSSDKARLLSEPLGAGSETWVASAMTGPTSLKLRPGTDSLYLAGGGYSTSLEHYSVAGATPVLVNSVSSYASSSCGDLWFSQAGSRIFTRCGQVFLASSSWTEDLTAAGTLYRPSTPYLTVRQLADSTAAGELSAITSGDAYSSQDDRVLRRWSAADLTLQEAVPLPTELVGGLPYRWGGRFVFYRSDGSARYVLLQLDPASGVLGDFGWVAF